MCGLAVLLGVNDHKRIDNSHSWKAREGLPRQAQLDVELELTVKIQICVLNNEIELSLAEKKSKAVAHKLEEETREINWESVTPQFRI